MALVDREVQIRGHIMGVLVGHTGQTITSDMIHGLADELIETVIDGDIRWLAAKAEEDFRNEGLIEAIPE